MGWKLIGKPVTQRVTKKLAKQFAEMDPAPHDRPLSERRLQVYEKLLAQGSFRPVTWATAICEETGGLYRVNGKHTSVLLSGLDVVPEFYVTVEEYECDTLEDVGRLYATFDSKMMSRTAGDIYCSFAGTVPELADIARSIVSACAAGIAYHVMGADAAHNAQPAERAELLLEYSDLVLFIAKVLSGRNDRAMDDKRHDRQAAHLKRMAVVAAMAGSWEKSKAAALEFWEAVRDETGAEPDLPDRKLARFLLTTGVYGGLGVRKGRPVSVREMYVKCIHAWNAWRANEPTNLRYYADAEVPNFK